MDRQVLEPTYGNIFFTSLGRIKQHNSLAHIYLDTKHIKFKVKI